MCAIGQDSRCGGWSGCEKPDRNYTKEPDNRFVRLATDYCARGLSKDATCQLKSNMTEAERVLYAPLSILVYLGQFAFQDVVLSSCPDTQVSRTFPNI